MKNAEDSITELLNLSKGVICHIFTKCPEKVPAYTNSIVLGLFEVNLLIPGSAFPIDKQRARLFTAKASQKQAAEKWAALFGCLELKKEGVFPDYAAQFLHILAGVEDSILPFYNDMCQANMQKVQANNAPNQNKKQKNHPSDHLSPPSPVHPPSNPTQYQPQKLEDHQILRKAKRKPIQDTPDEIFDFRIRTKSDLLQLGELDCACRFCKTPLCPASDISVDGNVIWCDSSQIHNQITELLSKMPRMSTLHTPNMTADEIDSLCETKSAIEFSINPMKTQRTLPFLACCKHCHEHVGVLELSEVGGKGRLNFTRDTVCFSVRELVNGKRVLIGAKSWRKILFETNGNTAEDLAKKNWMVYNLKINSDQVRYPHLDNQFFFSYFIFCTTPLFPAKKKKIALAGQLTLSEDQLSVIRTTDANIQGGLSLVRKPPKSDQWSAYIVPEFVQQEQDHSSVFDATSLGKLINNCNMLLKCDNFLEMLRGITLNDNLSKEDYVNSYFKNRIARTPYNARAYVVSCINFTLTPNSLISNSEVTFRDYYANKGMQITDETQPLIEVDMLSGSMSYEKGFKKYRNEQDRLIHLIPELTEMTGFTQELKSAAQLYKDLVPPAWTKLKFERNLAKFETSIGVTWENKDLIAQAFNFTTLPHQRLEFLGDSVLDFVVSAYYFIKKPQANEAKLTFMRANKVSNNNLSKLALDLNLLKCMPSCQDRLSKLLANVLEAVIGAIFLDKGLYVASQFVCTHILADPEFCDTLFTKFVPPPFYEQCCKPSVELLEHVLLMEKAIGYTFKNKALLCQAITHPSMFNTNYAHPTKDRDKKLRLTQQEIGQKANLDYERFEYLGDMLIKFFIGIYFYLFKPNLNAGDLSFLRHIYVMNDYFSQVAVKLHMHEVVLKPPGVTLPPITSSHCYLGDIFEAITCAIYLDSGCLDPKWKGFELPSNSQTAPDGGPAAYFICNTLLSGMSQEEEDSRIEMIKAKNALQAHYSKMGPNVVKYLELPKPPDCAFHVGVYVNNIMVGQGKGHNKQLAEKLAALNALQTCKDK
eukprot:Phypoly_transcript_01477.p1 GENE.Phypoly_transcript_01477~~Phypoly_transcript_01477.p1  ORF type:complete len:1044 (+),score=146.81 Phypoly_transcript_01477:223-3354(+)